MKWYFISAENTPQLAAGTGHAAGIFITRGFPEVVQIFCAHRDNLFVAFGKVHAKQNGLIVGYCEDIAKHSRKENAMHIESWLRASHWNEETVQSSPYEQFQSKSQGAWRF